MDDDLVSYPVQDDFKLAAGWLIEKAGWKKKSFNGISVHQQQALVLVNPEKRSGKEVVDYAKKIQQDIYDRYGVQLEICLLYTSPSPRDLSTSRMPSSA